MMDFEKELRSVLVRKDAPLGFADRVATRLPTRRASPVWRWAGLAVAASLLVTFSVSHYQDYRRGLQAKQQLLVALEITAEKLAVAQQTIEELNQRSIQ